MGLFLARIGLPIRLRGIEWVPVEKLTPLLTINTRHWYSVRICLQSDPGRLSQSAQQSRPDIPRFPEPGCLRPHLSLSKKDMATNDSKSSLRASFDRFEELILRHAVDRPPWTTGVLCPKDIGAITDYVSNRQAPLPLPPFHISRYAIDFINRRSWPRLWLCLMAGNYVTFTEPESCRAFGIYFSEKLLSVVSVEDAGLIFVCFGLHLCEERFSIDAEECFR